MGVADAVRALPIHHFLEAVLPQGYSQAHLSTPIVLGWTPGYSVGSLEDDKSGTWWKNWTHATNGDLLADMRDKLASGCLYMTYFTYSRNLTNCSLFEHMYPITVRELHAGWIVGEERILMIESGIYGWNDTTSISGVEAHCFDAQANGVAVKILSVAGADQTNSFSVRVPKLGACALVRVSNNAAAAAASGVKTDDEIGV